MACPQIENGHIDIANEISEAFQKLHLTGNQWKLLWVIIRQTWGWHKPMEKISVSFFEKQTGLDRRDVVKGLKKLGEMKIINISKNLFINTYGMQKDYENWKDKTIGKITNSLKPLVKSPIPIGEIANETIGDFTTHKRKKETTTKERGAFEEIFWKPYPSRNGKKVG